MTKKESTNILHRLADDDKKALEELFRFFYEEMCRYAFSMLQDRLEAEDIVQDIFLQIWEKRKKLVIKESIRAYLFTATHNNSLQKLKHKLVIDKHVTEKSSTNNRHPQSDDNLHLIELQKLVTKTMESLPEQTRYIFYLSRIEGLKYAEIATKVEISIKTVEAKMGYALKQFRYYLKEYIT